jgi:nucleoside-diphosphate-sugar epimerase
MDEMRVVVTGGFGFIGTMVARELLTTGTFQGRELTELVLADRFVPRDDDALTDPRTTVVEGDLLETVATIFTERVDAVAHLAPAVSAEAEADFDLGMTANLKSTVALLEAARHQQGEPATVTFSSSVAVYGSDPALPLPDVVSESTLPTPQSSYGAQKFICEQLVADYTRKGFIDGRVARLMTVAVRPGKPNAAASGFLSGIIREPLAGIATVCPVRPELSVALASPRRTVEGLLRVAQVERGDDRRKLNGRIAVNLPALTVTVGEMLDTLRRVAGNAVADLVSVEPDPAVEAIVGSWPSRFDNSRAAALGLTGDASFADVVEQYRDDNL